ncbi:MAG: glycogen synthase [Balneolales bacterium]
MHVIHISFECFPVAKAGGLGDVVGSLPKYLQLHDITSWVVMPHFDIKWLRNHELETIHEGIARLGNERFRYRIAKEQGDVLGFPVYFVDVPGRLDRSGIYIDPNSDFPYWDEYERFLTFQISVLDWLKSFSKKPDIIHCHDHHTALIPFFMTSSPVYHEFTTIPSVLTVHNGNYQGWYDIEKRALLPKIEPEREGFLYWNGQLNALSAGIRTSWRVTTVSNTYLKELQQYGKGLESLFSYENGKSLGILNGIDTEVWDPESDSLIACNYTRENMESGKKKNKDWLCRKFKLNPEWPLFTFIGRLVGEKGADLLPDLITRFIESGLKASFHVLGTGEPWLHQRLMQLQKKYPDYFYASLTYNEQLSHQLYAGSDFLLMPSRVEPCGLNQMYALRYGTLPVVRSVGGLKDTVIDLSEPEGYGIRFDHFNIEDAFHALQRALLVYSDKMLKKNLRLRAMSKDFSWHNSAKQYFKMYQSLIKI